MWRHLIHEYLGFTKKESAGIFILLGCIMLCLSAPFIYPYFIREKSYHHSQFDEDISRLKIKQADSSGKKYSNSYPGKNFDENNYTNYYEPSERNNYTKPKGELFFFDPNTVSVNDWKRLGIREKTAATIQKYISKGGRFYKPEDIGKIWGLHKDEVERLLPYVKIGSAKKEYAEHKTGFHGKKPDYVKPSPQTIDINAADTTAFISLPGIGSKLAQRIILFRDKLGGFYSIEQVKETYGLPDSVFQKIKPKLAFAVTTIKQININNATIDELKSHPYLRYNLANAIFQYRTQHGSFSAVADIKRIMIITDEIFNKVSPYLTVN